MEFDDASRLAALADYRLLDTPAEEAFDNITLLTAKLFNAPIALVTLVDERRQWFKSRFGFEMQETPREQSFCDHTIRAGEPLIVKDASTDPRFMNNPLVTSGAGIRFYCGVPLRTPEGYGLGALCLIDRVPRTLSQSDVALLASLARQVEIEFEIWIRLAALQDTLREHREEKYSRQMLAAMFVHDLRSPLTSLMMLTTLVRPADDESRARLETIVAEAERMRRMACDILDICLSDIGKLRLRRRVFALGPVAEAVVRRMERLARIREQPLKLELPAEPPLVDADPHLVDRVIENLVANAIHHGPPGRVILVAVRVIAPTVLSVEVHDAGEVIPDEKRAEVFNAHKRSDWSVSGYHGYGLGLAFCNLVVEAHGGHIAVSPDADGGGNRFHFTLAAAAALPSPGAGV